MKDAKENIKIKSNKREDNITEKATKTLSAIIFILVGVIGGVLLKGFINFKNNEEEPKEEEKKEEIVSIYDIEPIIKEYSTIDKSKVYLYNINEVYVKDNTLKEYLKKYKKVDTLFDDISDTLTILNELEDGTKIYKSNLFQKDLTVIRCNTDDGNKDIYIGDYVSLDKAFKNGVCGKRLFNDTTFTKNYYITKITPLEDDYYNLNILDKVNNKSITIKRKMSSETMKIVHEKEEYTFHFQNRYNDYLEDDIEDIFNKASLVGVVPVNK